MPTRQTTVTAIFHNMSAMRRLMFQHAAGAKMSESGPTHAQLGLMFALSHKDNPNVGDLAKCFGMTSSAATQLITGLVKRGWVIRRAVTSDKRQVSLKLSATGQRVLKTIIAKRSALFAKSLEVLSDQELAQLQAIQEKIIANHAAYADSH